MQGLGWGVGGLNTLVETQEQCAPPLDFVIEKMLPVYEFWETVVERDKSKDYNEAILLGDSLPTGRKFFSHNLFLSLMINIGRANNEYY